MGHSKTMSQVGGLRLLPIQRRLSQSLTTAGEMQSSSLMGQQANTLLTSYVNRKSRRAFRQFYLYVFRAHHKECGKSSKYDRPPQAACVS